MSEPDLIASLRSELRSQLSSISETQSQAARFGVPLTVVSLPRHGHATALVTVDSFYRNTGAEAAFIYLDVMGPPSVRESLADWEAATPGFTVLRIDRHVSRQMARLLVLDRIRTPYTLFLDNNMLLAQGMVDELLRTAEDRGAAVVSPVIVMQGGGMHFSGARISPAGEDWFERFQTTPEAPATVSIEDCVLSRHKIDFAESHCCLMRTDVFRDDPAALFPVEMHNSHTIAVTCRLHKQREPDAVMLIEPRAVASILPIAFGYDIPWLFESYNRWEYYRQSYAFHFRLVPSPSSSPGNLFWHRKHFLYLLTTLLEENHLDRRDQLAREEVPKSVRGYDQPLPPDVEALLERDLAPVIESRYPAYTGQLYVWLHEFEDAVENIDYYAAKNGPGRRVIPVPVEGKQIRRHPDYGVVLVDDATGQGIKLNAEAYSVWSLCDGVNSEMDIERALLSEFPDDASEIVKGVEPLLQQLEAHGAVVLHSPRTD